MEKFLEFMRGRYGFDGLDAGLLFVSVLMNLVSMFLYDKSQMILSIVAIIPIVICVARFLSKNISARQKENQIFLNLVTPLLLRATRHKSITKGNKSSGMQDKKLYKFFKCPTCGQKVRVPRGKGKIEILCPNCTNKFIKRT